MQYNWIPLSKSADVMDLLASVDMHGIQTSGNCIRNITSDERAGIAVDEIADPRPFAEIMRQWSTLHPEFAFLPRKFKIAITGATEDRAATGWHDVGLHLVKNDAGELGFRVQVGGGMGRTPIIGTVLREFLPWNQIMNYLEAVIRVYNRYGRRDNIYKARIKILVKAEGQRYIDDVEAEYKQIIEHDGAPHTITQAEFDRVSRLLRAADAGDPRVPQRRGNRRRPARARPPTTCMFARWLARNVAPHKNPALRAVTLSFKRRCRRPAMPRPTSSTPPPAWPTASRAGEARVTHDQNLLLPWVHAEDLHALWLAAREAGFASANVHLLTDMIACPGGDFCALANARSIPIAEAITERYQDLDELDDLGEIDLHISGCINSCGHHHSGHIGILGVDKDGKEWYQVTLGGSDGSALSGAPQPGKVVGPSFSAAEVPDVIEAVLNTYRDTPRRRPARPSSTRCAASASSLSRPPPTARASRSRRPHEQDACNSIAAEDHVDDGDPNVLQLANDADPLAIEVCLDDVERIDLDFPKFTDGRAYSQAFLLRRRLGFKGDIRATGDVLIDQLVQMQRTGFSSAVLKEGVDASAAQRQFDRFAAFYQGDAVQATPHLQARLSDAGTTCPTETSPMSIDLAQVNAKLGRNAEGLVDWAIGLGRPAIVTTNFRPFEAVILHMVTRAKPDVPVVWMDNGYNTEATYRFADEVTKLLDLDLRIYLPRRSRAHREAVEGPTPALDDPRHAAFTEEVKLEPFARALRETAPQGLVHRAARHRHRRARADGPGQHQSRRPDQGRAAAALVVEGSARLLPGARPAQQLRLRRSDQGRGQPRNAVCTSRTDRPTPHPIHSLSPHSMNARTEPDLLLHTTQSLARLSNTHLDALEEETIFILREVAAAFERPTLLFSGGKDSLVLLKCAEKAFGAGRIPYPLLMIDTGHNFPEVTDFRDCARQGTGRRADRAQRRGLDEARHGAPGAPGRIAQRAPVGDAARSDRGIPLRRADRRRPPRRGKGPRQGAHLFAPRQLRPMAAQGPAARAVDAVQHAPAAGRALPRVPDLELDRAGRVAIHRAREHRPALDLLHAQARSGRAPRPAGAGDRAHAAARRRAGRSARRALPHRGRHHLHLPGRKPRRRCRRRGDRDAGRRRERTRRHAHGRQDLRSLDGKAQEGRVFLMDATAP